MVEVISSSRLLGVSELPRGAVTQNHALQSFHFRWLDNDHNVSRIQLSLRGDNITAAFKDRNNDDPYSIVARYLEIPASVAPTQDLVQRFHSGVNRISINGLNSNVRFVLCGFRFEVARDDMYLLSFTLLPDERNGQLLVIFRDDDSEEDWSITVQYKLVPLGFITADYSGFDEVFGNNRSLPGLPVGEPTRCVIGGFGFTYIIGDQRLLEAGIDTSNHRFFFRDSDLREIIRVRARYYSLANF